MQSFEQINKKLSFMKWELQEILNEMREENFNKLPISTQLQIKLERIRRDLRARELFNKKLNPKDFIINEEYSGYNAFFNKKEDKLSEEIDKELRNNQRQINKL